MRTLRAAALAVAMLLPATGPRPAAAQTVQELLGTVRAGDYGDAERGLRRALEEDPASWRARQGLVEVLVMTGEYEEAEELARAAPDGLLMANTLGEVLLLRGKLDEADAAFRRAVEGRAPDALVAEVNLAELLFDRGRIDEAMQRFDRFIDVYNEADGRLRAPELVAVGRAVRYLGRNEPALFNDALRAFDEAAKADPGWAEPGVRAGELFLEKYSSPEAQAEFQRVLGSNPRHADALFGLAKALAFDNSPDAGRTLNQLLELNPNHVGALSLLARQHLTRERHEEAKELAERALEVNPSSLTALTTLAGAHLLDGDRAAFEAARRRALAINPRYAGLDTDLAELAVQTRRYAEAVARAGAAVRLDPAAWTAWGLLGMNQMRIGAMEEGRANLEKAFEGDPYNPWFKNNLDLLDTFERYEVRSTEHFDLFLHSDEAELLATYLAPIAEEAYDSLSRRYGMEPDHRLRVELFPDHADFSVRTLGEVGLGALGVSFGPVLVMDSPSARQLGDYNWASVFWHELAHSFHLAITDHRVPRWFSEGLAVHEQRKARGGWGHQPTIPFLAALGQGDLKKVSELNDGFMRPDYPQQVVFSYYQASLVFQVIEERHGFDAIRRMLDGYRSGATTPQLFETVLGTPIEDFDEEFEAYLTQRFEKPLRGLVRFGEAPDPRAGIEALQDFAARHPGDLLARLRLGAALVGEERFEEAKPHLDEALRMFPEYGGPDSPYWYLAQIHRAQGDNARAAAALRRLNELSEANYRALVTEAEVLETLDRQEEAARALDRAVLVWPFEPSLHHRLAELHARYGNLEAAVRERRAVVALDPVDKAEAHYELALAQYQAGDARGARRSVLMALDVAPNYEEALELLLKLRGGTELSW